MNAATSAALAAAEWVRREPKRSLTSATARSARSSENRPHTRTRTCTVSGSTSNSPITSSRRLSWDRFDRYPTTSPVVLLAVLTKLGRQSGQR